MLSVTMFCLFLYSRPLGCQAHTIHEFASYPTYQIKNYPSIIAFTNTCYPTFILGFFNGF